MNLPAALSRLRIVALSLLGAMALGVLAFFCMPYPWLAAVPGAGMVALYRFSRRSIALVAASGWLLYLPYEYGMKWRILCSGECNIRVDLLLLYPLLLAVSFRAFIGLFGKFWPPAGDSVSG